ncbi:MAG: hypothetical protein M0C28_00485 [Candidatus Moduliflexus flocculans]|nr:hypothetical protein [Candidatus Moduliflexus flocculans]
MTFGVVADCQFAAVPASGSRFYDRSWLKLREALDEFNARGVRFVVHLGDLIDRDAASYDLILPGPRPLAGARALRPRQSRLRHRTRPQRRPPRPAGPRAGLLRLHRGGLALRRPERRRARPQLPQGREPRPGVGRDVRRSRGGGPAQRHEMERWDRPGPARLPRTGARGGRPERPPGRRPLSFPVYPPAGHNLWNDEEVVALLERHPSVKAFFSGHNHAGGLAVRNGIAYLTFAGMVETAATSAAAVVTLTEDRMVVDGTGREPDRTVLLR